MADTIRVNLSLNQARDLIESTIVDGSVTGEMIDEYVLKKDECTCIVMVFEKHYYRVANRLTLTVILDDFNGMTKVHMIGGGGGDGLFRFDWGAADSFQDSVLTVLEPYRR